MKKNDYLIFIIMAAVILITILNCVTTEEPVPFVLVQLAPPPPEPTATPEPTTPPDEPPPPPEATPKPTKKPKPDLIIKAEIVQHLGKKLLLNVGTKTDGIKKGLTGTAYNDSGLTQEAGIVKITDVRPTFCYVDVTENYMAIEKTAIIIFRIKQK